ncbi:hypothetical protein FKM82_021301 [Ascaphus truei]
MQGIVTWAHSHGEQKHVLFHPPSHSLDDRLEASSLIGGQAGGRLTCWRADRRQAHSEGRQGGLLTGDQTRGRLIRLRADRKRLALWTAG